MIKYKSFWEQRGGKLESFRRNMTQAEKSAIETMAESRYQQVNDSNVGPLSIDRVTRDGARDIVGDLQDKLRSGPFYDMSKAPVLHQMTAEERSLVSSSPLAQYEGQIEGLQAHLEENYDYAKRIEGSIDSSRKNIATELLAMQKQLSQIKDKKEALAGSIEESHRMEVGD